MPYSRCLGPVLTCYVLTIPLLLFSLHGVADAQLNIIHQEGFNDDGDGTRYVMTGRGQAIGPDGPGAWEHNFLVNAIGLPSTAAARRAAILWTDNAIDDDFTDESLMIWDNLIDYMLDGKENATVGFLPNTASPTGDFLSFRLEDAGHTFMDIDGDLPDPSEVDLVIHTAGGNPPTPTAFVEYPVPVITYNAGNHDDTLISSIGAVTSGGPTQVTIVDEFSDHPVLGGLSGTIPWIDEFIAEEPLQGIGGAIPAGSTTLATYVDPATEQVLPALLLVEEGDNLLGAFAPTPEGTGYIIGGDMNLDFGDGAASAEDPKTLTLDAVDVSGETGVRLSVDLAATTVDFEPPDLLRVLYAPDDGEEFVTLADFVGNAGSLVDPELGALNADEFTTFTFDIPDDATNLVVKFEAFSTFPNEVLGIDNVVIFTGEPGDPLDCNGDGILTADDVLCATGETISDILAGLNVLPGDLDLNQAVEFADFLIMSANFGDETKGGVYGNGDIDLNGAIEFADFLVLSANFGSQVGVAAVPEPATITLLAFAGLMTALLRRRPR